MPSPVAVAIVDSTFKPQLGMTSQALSGVEKRVLPGVRGKAKRSFTVTDGNNAPVTINKGDEIIIQPLGIDKFNITPFKRVNLSSNPDLPESQRDIVPGATYTASDINPRRNFIFKEHYALTDKPLFKPGSPKLGDIEQSQIPDCFLLASIQAILNEKNGDVFIKSMMRQHDDGTATVRLFDPQTKEPVYYRVQTAELVDEKGKSLNKHPALWVHVLENAYSAMATKNGNKTGEINRVDASSGSVFSGGGRSAFAMEILTGIAAAKNYFLQSNSNMQQKIWDFNKDDLEFIEKAQKREDGVAYLKRAMSDKIELASTIPVYKNNNDAGTKDAVAFMYFFQQNKEACELITKNPETSDGDKLFALMNLALENNAVDAANYCKNVVNHLFVQVADAQGNVNGVIRGEAKSFSGFYSVKKMELYNDIEKGLANNQLLTAGTPAHSPENPIMTGLHAGHAYSVLAVRQDESGNRFVKLRNPWGHGGMMYENPNDNSTVKSDHSYKAIFEVELNDFYNNFATVEISKSSKSLFALDVERNALTYKANDLVRNHAVDDEITLSDLVDFQRDYKSYEKSLVKLEQQHLEGIPSLEMIHIMLKREDKEELIPEEIQGMIQRKEIDISTMAGTPEQKLEQVTRLLELSLLEIDPHTNKDAIAEMKGLIAKNAGYDFCEKVNETKLVADTIASGFAMDFISGVQACQELVTKFEAQAKEIGALAADNKNDPAKNEMLHETYQQVKTQSSIVFLEKSYVENLGINIKVDSQQLLDMRDAIKNGQAFLSQHNEVMQLSEELAKEEQHLISHIDERVARKQLSPEKAERYKNCIRLNKEPGDAKKNLEKELLNSIDPIEKGIGQKMSFISKIFQKLSNALESLAKLISGSPKNNYNIEASKSSCNRFKGILKHEITENTNHNDGINAPKEDAIEAEQKTVALK